MSALAILFSVFAFAGEPTPDLDGLWTQGCRHGYIRSEKIQGSQAELVEQNFGDRNCSRIQLEIKSAGELIFGAALSAPAGAFELDFRFHRVVLTVRDAGVAALYNAQFLCGRNDWQVDMEREITGLKCDFFRTGSPFRAPIAGDMRFGIVKREGNSLFFGRLSPQKNAMSPDRRPQEFDSVPYIFHLLP